MTVRSSGPIYQGQRVQIESDFRVLGVLSDPLVVQCTIRPPSGGDVTLTYPDANLTRVDTGRYVVAHTVTEGGSYWFRLVGIGGVEAVNEINVDVEHSHVVV